MTPSWGEETSPVPGPSHDEPGTAGWIPCCICTDPIRPDQYATAVCWADPHGHTCAAHRACLIAVGETELQLPPAA